MNLISALCSGIAGAANGWVELYIRGTSTRATWYGDFEASTSNSSGDNIDLDAYGAVEVYVNQLVDVVAKSPDGTIIRSWTDGYASGNVEVVSPSFTGHDYVSGAAAVNEPTTLQSVLDLWETNAGAPDWKVEISGAPTTLEDAFGALTGLVFNVKSPEYGAVGDGVVNDQAAIAAALADAVAAGGGTVYFPRGIYIVSTVIEWPHTVNMWGVGSGLSVIKTSSVSNARILQWSTGTAQAQPQIIQGMSFDASVVNSGNQLDMSVAAKVSFVRCGFGLSSNCTGNLVDASGGGVFSFTDCFFGPNGVSRAVRLSGAHLTNMVGCNFKPNDSSYNTEIVTSFTGRLTISGCTFDAGNVSVLPTLLRGLQANSGSVCVTGSRFLVGSQNFNVCVAGAAGAQVVSIGNYFQGSSVRYAVSGGAPLADGSYLELVPYIRVSSASTAITIDGNNYVSSYLLSGGVPTFTLPTPFYPGQRIIILAFNNTGVAWGANVTISGGVVWPTVTTTASGGSVAIFEFVAVALGSATVEWQALHAKVTSA